MIFEVSTAMNIHVVVFWVVTPCSNFVGHERFEGPCCLHLKSEMKDHCPILLPIGPYGVYPLLYSVPIYINVFFQILVKHRKYKGLKLCGGGACYRSSV